MAPRVKLTYFPLYGRVETMKMCLAYGKVLDKFAVLTEKKLNTIHFGGEHFRNFRGKQNKRLYGTMVSILDGKPEIVAHVRSNLYYLTGF